MPHLCRWCALGQEPACSSQTSFPFEIKQEFVGRFGLALTSFTDIRSQNRDDWSSCLGLSVSCASIPRGLSLVCVGRFSGRYEGQRPLCQPPCVCVTCS